MICNMIFVDHFYRAKDFWGKCKKTILQIINHYEFSSKTMRSDEVQFRDFSGKLR